MEGRMQSGRVHRPMTWMRCRALSAVLSGVSVLAAGCVAEGPAQKQAPRPVQTQPEGLTVERIVPTMDRVVDDTDRNGYYDTLRIAVFLFSGSPRYKQSIHAEG